MRKRPGEVRDAIVHVLGGRPRGASVYQITQEVVNLIGDVAPSSVRSYLQLNTPGLFARTERAQYALQEFIYEPPKEDKPHSEETFVHGKAKLLHADCLPWLEKQ
ncbi:MAG TPA: hypothetical protein VJN94_03455, partial [Candidatus Binataceae bacterium]|nr:hypothetical protein [Candidatus Binataceae bacterium]